VSVLRQEHVVLLATLGIVGVAYATLDSGPRAPARPDRRSAKASEASAIDTYAVPDVSRALPRTGRKPSDLDRDLFSPPRDTLPLPPLELVDPPREPATALRPPPEPAMKPSVFGRFLRADATPRPVPGLFAAESSEAGEGLEVDELGAPEEGGDLADELAALGRQAPAVLSPEERAAQIESWKKLYDWIRLGEAEPLFGQIRNPDRYGLAAREREAVLFVEVAPETGAERFPGQKPVAYERSRVTEIAFADTPSNRIAILKRTFVPPIGPSRYEPLLEFAARCVEMRLEAREALAVAEEMYRLAMQTQPDDPMPALGLARCYEAGFRFEPAFEVYEDLLQRFAHRPEVHVRMAELEARFRLFDSARARMLEAEKRGGKSMWQVQWPFGRLELERGSFDQAALHLQEAFRREPSGQNEADARTRAKIRCDLGCALLAQGDVAEALESFERALQADPGDARALAGRLSAIRLGAKPRAAIEERAQGEAAGFDLVMARALAAIDEGEGSFPAARDLLAQAAGADPLRAPRAWRAMSWLAEIAGYPEEAVRWIERAVEGEPDDAWSLYQLGRLAAARDDAERARDALVRALGVDVDFTDALIALAELAVEGGAANDAELYYERALSLEASRAEVWARRGLNLVHLGEAALARDCFARSLAADREQPLALAGSAWLTYLAGDPDKSIAQLAELDDVRRAKPESDPYRRWAKAQMARIQDHLTKVLWTDRFERKTLINGWEAEEAAGPIVTLENGALTIAGQFKSQGATRVWRTYAAPDFVSIEATITLPPDPKQNNSKVGLFVSKERAGRGIAAQTQGKLAIARRRDGVLVVLTADQMTADENWEDVPDAGAPWWSNGQSVRLKIERTGEGNESTARISIDGIAVREGIRLARLAQTSNELRVGIFCEGQTGLPAAVTVDDVEVVYRERR
jgi:tetratricopeptide (TPR) repeat protein